MIILTKWAIGGSLGSTLNFWSHFLAIRTPPTVDKLVVIQQYWLCQQIHLEPFFYLSPPQACPELLSFQSSLINLVPEVHDLTLIWVWIQDLQCSTTKGAMWIRKYNDLMCWTINLMQSEVVKLQSTWLHSVKVVSSFSSSLETLLIVEMISSNPSWRRNFWTSIAAWTPWVDAVSTWQYRLSTTSPAAETPSLFVDIEMLVPTLNWPYCLLRMDYPLRAQDESILILDRYLFLRIPTNWSSEWIQSSEKHCCRGS